MTSTSTSSLPGAGFFDLIVVAIVIAVIVGAVRDLRAHSDEDETGQDDGAGPGLAAVDRPALPPSPPADARRLAVVRRRARAKYRTRSARLRDVMPVDPDGEGPLAVIADGAVNLLALLSGYCAELLTGLYRPRRPGGAGELTGAAKGAGDQQASDGAGRDRPELPPQTGAGDGRIGLPRRDDDVDLDGSGDGSGDRSLWARFQDRQREVPVFEVVDPGSGNRTDAARRESTIDDAELVGDGQLARRGGSVLSLPPSAGGGTLPIPAQGGFVSNLTPFIHTLSDLFRHINRRVGVGQEEISRSQQRAIAGANRAEQTGAVAAGSLSEATGWAQLYEHWAAHRMDARSLEAVETAHAAAVAKANAEQLAANAEIEAAAAARLAAEAGQQYMDTLIRLGSTVQTHQVPHAVAQAETGNAAAHHTVLEIT